MATITIENVPETFIKKYFKTTFSYDEVKIEPKKYIETDEYKNENFEVFQSMEDLVIDLQKYKK